MSISGPVVLAILDGWGIGPAGPGNAVTLARTPTINAWRQEYPATYLGASGLDVGLVAGQAGNSEAGHMNIGAGRIVAQENVRISESINNGTFFRNAAFLSAFQHVQHHDSTLHLMGMLGSSQSAHADPDHLLALLMLAQNYRLQKVFLHIFTDGRDSPPYIAHTMLQRLMPHLGDVRIGTIMGRFFAMDRNKNWERTQLAYDTLSQGQSPYRSVEPTEAISRGYNRGESDEFISPTVIEGYTGINDGDAMIFFNLRSDRARQLTKAFVQRDFEVKNAATKPFHRQKVLHRLTFVAMTDFGPDLSSVLTAFPAVALQDTLPMVWKNYRQLYLAESEKYAHVTYFFNGGYADPVAGEDRMMVPSPRVKHYDQVPAMSSQALTDVVCQSLREKKYDIIVVNFANTDMVGHTGNLAAGITAMEVADHCVALIGQQVLAHHGLLAITGDHGNLESMKNQDNNEIDTEHSGNPVPLMVVAHQLQGRKLQAGVLADIAPTLLQLMDIPIPHTMTGHPLLLP